MTIALQVFVTGLAAGGVYGLFAAGHTLIYRLTGMVNFAFGDLVGLGVFATLLVLSGTAPVTQSGAHEPRFLAALGYAEAGLALCEGAEGWGAGIDVADDRGGMFLAVALIAGDEGENGEDGVHDDARGDDQHALAHRLLAIGARVVGVPVDLLVALAFGLVGALAMIAAIAAAPGQAVNANTGTLLGLKGLVAALAVRFGPPLLAFGAGLLLGVVESAIANVHLGSWQLGPSYREVLPLAFVLLLIAIWPSREALEEQE